MKLGLVTPGWPGHNTPNGIATSVYHLAMGLQAIGHEPVIITITKDGPQPEGIPVFSLQPRSWSILQKIRHRFGALDIQQEVFGQRLADAVDKAAIEHDLDAVIVEETHGWANAIIAAQTVPVVVFLHGPWILHQALQSDGNDKRDRNRLAKEAKLFAAGTALISPAQQVLEAVEQAVDVSHMPRKVIRNSYPVRKSVSARERQILFVGRYDRHKGGDTVIKAFEHLAARRADVTLTFAGPDSGVLQADGTSQSIKTAISQLPKDTQDRLNWVGRQTVEDIAKLRNTHTIALIASRFENLNYTMLEAMAAGQAIVSTNVGGPAEVLEHEKTALLVPSDDPVAMSKALERLWDDPDLAQSLGRAARQTLSSDFAPEFIAEDLVQFLNGAL